MLPTLLGRWQTRLILLIFIGLPVTFVFALAISDWRFPILLEPFLFLLTFFAIGFIFDVVYQQMQRFRWDNDWPFAYFVIATVFEFLLTYGLLYVGALPYLNSTQVPFGTAVVHFLLVFIPSFVAVLAIIQVFLIRWRYKGGEIGRLPISE